MTTDPIVLFGTGRCGSTALHDVLSRHRRLAWLSRMNILFPGRPAVNRWFQRAIDLPGLGPWLHDTVTPTEPYPFHDRLHAGISESCRDLRADDISASEATRVRSAWEANLTSTRDRLLIKFTGWPRVGLVQQILPNARFVHIVRDGRAVAYSILRVPFWQGWRGPEHWRYGQLSADDTARWDASDRSFAVLAGIEWRILMDAAEEAKALLPPDRLLEIRYEDLCADTDAVIDEVLRFTGLERTPAFERALARFDLTSRNDAWRDALSSTDQGALRELLGETLQRYGYTP